MSETGLYVQDEPEFLRSFKRKRERETEMVKMHKKKCEWERADHLSHSLLPFSFLRITLSGSAMALFLSLVWLYPAESLEMELLCSGWDSKAMSHYISKCTTSIHCAVVSGGWDVWMRCGVVCGGSIEQWPPWLWLDPLCQLYSGPSVTPAGPGWVFYQDLPSLKIQEREREKMHFNETSLLWLIHLHTLLLKVRGR